MPRSLRLGSNCISNTMLLIRPPNGSSQVDGRVRPTNTVCVARATEADVHRRFGKPENIETSGKGGVTWTYFLAKH